MSLSGQFKHEMGVELVEHSASDSSVVKAARVSTLGEAVFSIGDTTPRPSPVSADVGLIDFLMKNRHGTPFEHNMFTWRIHAPIFVIREFQRHRMFSYNEESGRYKTLEPYFYLPKVSRKLRQVGKAGAYTYDHGEPEQYEAVYNNVTSISIAAYEAYQDMLDAGVAREVARMVLPLNIYSSMYVTGNARALMNFLSLRVQSDSALYPSYPQEEIQMVAEKMEETFAKAMPVTHASFVSRGRVSP